MGKPQPHRENQEPSERIVEQQSLGLTFESSRRRAHSAAETLRCSFWVVGWSDGLGNWDIKPQFFHNCFRQWNINLDKLLQ